MTTHIGVLPLDILHTLSTSLEQKESANASTGLPFIRLPHPRTGISSLFLPFEPPADESASDTQSEILEVQAVSSPDPRSWFVGQEVVADGKFLIMTPIDPTFLLVYILQAVQPSDGTTGNFRPIDDIIEDASLKLETSGEADDAPVTRQDIIRFAALKCAKRAIRHICDVKEITPEIVVYRLSHPKVLEYLRGKIARLSSADALEVSRTVIRSLARDGLMEDGKEALLQAGRTRAACDLTSHYLSPDLRQSLISSYNFTHLDEYLKKINIEVLTTTVDKKSGKGKEKVVTEDGKKRKGSKASQGVENLKKVNIKGMAKLSSFFKKT